ncbi:MAG: hypothetical protein AAF267_02070 [Deinococcota bacterium]
MSAKTSQYASRFELRAAQHNLLAQEDDPLAFDTTPIPFEITSDFDVATLDAVSTGPTRVVVAAATGYVDAPLYDNGSIALNEVALYDTQRRIVALDVLRPTLRVNHVFSYENTARTQVMAAHPLLHTRSRNILNDPEDEVWIRIYNAVDDHPRFEDFVTLIRNLGYVPVLLSDPNNDAYYQFAYDIAIDLVREFFDETGQLKSQ